MLDRIEVNVIDVSLLSRIVYSKKRRCQMTRSRWRERLAETRSPRRSPPENVVLMSRQQVEKSQSPAGNVQNA